MIPVVRFAPGNQWDQNMIDQLLDNQLYPTGLQFERCETWPPDADGVVAIIPGRYWHDRTEDVTRALARFRWVLAIRTSDEEDLLDITKVEHPHIRWWVQTPRTGRDYGDARRIPLGFPPHFNQLTDQPRELEVFLSAQRTHARRAAAFEALAPGPGRWVMPQHGFTQGLSPMAYAHAMASAKIAPAPAGAVSPDSFRVYEALEAHAVPIADDVSPVYDSRGYWRAMFPDAPFPILTDYADLPGWIDDQLAQWPRNANRIATWWMRYKRRLSGWLVNDLAALEFELFDHSVHHPAWDPITVVISTSPIKSHPDTRIIDETIASVRAQLPDAEIILMHDGVRPQDRHRRADYEEYTRRVLWKADHEWGRVLPLLFDEHLHQGECTRRALEYVRTPLVLFVEGDTPLCGEIPWDDITGAILAGNAALVRFSHEASILEPHRYLMLDEHPQLVHGVPMTRTVQWSQRPHLASTAFYHRILDQYFGQGERNFIEEVMHGRLISDWDRYGVTGWMSWRTWIYTPPGDIKRSYHTDGREGAPNYV